MSALLDDLRASVFRLLRAPAFVALGVGSLAIGLAMTLAFAAVGWTLAYEPLALPAPERLVAVWTTEGDNRSAQFAAGNFAALRRSAESFEALAAYSPWNLVVAGRTETERVSGALVSGEFFAVLGLAPIAGRGLQPSDDVDGQDRVAVLSEVAARRWFGSADAAIGRQLTVNGASRAVVGVMPTGRVLLPEVSTDLWIPLGLAPAATADTAGGWLRSVGRLRPGVGLEAAGQEMIRVAGELQRLDPIHNGERGLRLLPLRQELAGDFERWLGGFALAIGLLAVLVTVNFGGLVRVRAEAEASAWWVREIVGAAPARLRRLRALEGMWLGLAAAVLGAGGAWLLLRGLGSVVLLRSPTGSELGLPWWGWLTAASAVVALAAAGSMIRTRRSTHLTRSRATLAVRRSVVVIQLALAMPLLIGGALLDRSLSSLRAEPLGFDARQVVSASVSLPRTRYADATAQSAVVERMLEGVRVLPGVEGAAAVSDLPLVGNHMAFEVTLEGRAGVGPKPTLGTRVVTASYFRTLAIPLRAGRLFAGTDDGQGEPVALLNESAARVLWPLASSIGAVGGRLRLGDEGGWLRVVGVVGDVHHMGVARGELPAIYLPLAQKPFDWLNWTTLVVRGGNAAESLRSVVRAVDPEVPVYDVQTLDELRDREFAPRLWLRRLLVAFAAISSFLVALGVYGVTSLYVTSRRRELGVRAALGASPWRAVALVVRQVATPAAAGAGVGLLIWLAVGRLLEAQFFRVDGARLEGVVLALAAVLAAVAAALVAPALRAWRAQPAALLRET